MRRLFCVLVLILFNFPIAQGSTVGKEFVFGSLSFPGSLLKIDIASYTSGNVHIYIPYLGINQTSSFDKTFSLALSTSIALDGTRVEHKGVYIKSDKDISVYATSLYSSYSYSDTYVVIPLDSLGKKYEIASYDPNSGSYPSVFMVIAALNNTFINVSFPNGTSISKTLNWLDVYQEASLSTDLTGTIVQSTNPVSVVSGAPYSRVLNQGSIYDMLGEQLLSVDAFETYFIVPPIYNSHSFMVRMFSNQIPNRVCVKNASIENCTMVGPKKWIESEPASTALVVTSQEPISVVQYKAGAPNYMTNIPGLEQFMNSYAFVVPFVYSSQVTYVAVTIRSSAIHTLRLDGRSPADQIVNKANVPAPLNEYTVLTYTIASGYHVMTSNETNVLFGLLLFGFVSYSSTAFATPAGMRISSASDEYMCYNCNDMSDLELCDTVQRCAPGQRCIVQQGLSQYSSGCANTSLCHIAKSSNGHCMECCHGDFCNGHGCGDNGLVPRSQRGPMCYDCNHVLKPDLCKNVRPCFEDELCSIEEFDWLGHSHFKLGCVAASCSAIEHHRSVPRCKSCCSEDFCNTNCTMSHNHGASIIG